MNDFVVDNENDGAEVRGAFGNAAADTVFEVSVFSNGVELDLENSDMTMVSTLQAMRDEFYTAIDATGHAPESMYAELTVAGASDPSFVVRIQQEEVEITHVDQPGPESFSGLGAFKETVFEPVGRVEQDGAEVGTFGIKSSF